MVTEPSPETLLAGTSYAGHAILGQGGMGFVIEATHRTLGHRVAVKLLHADLPPEANLAERLQAEGRVLAGLRSQHLVRVSDAGVTARGEAFIVMEKLTGVSLADHLRLHAPLDLREAARIAVEALDGIAVAHDAGVVHRDLKPANLFLADENGGRVCKVLDFGIAKFLEPDGAGASMAGRLEPTAPGMIVGSPRYMSPEQARAERVDARSDIYSMGCVLFAMITGRSPFDDCRGLVEFCLAHNQKQPPRLGVTLGRAVPEQLEAIVARCLEKDPERRYGNARELAAELRGFAASTGAVPAASNGHRAVAISEGDVHASAPLKSAPVAISPLATTPLPRDEPASTTDVGTRFTSVAEPGSPAAVPERAAVGSNAPRGRLDAGRRAGSEVDESAPTEEWRPERAAAVRGDAAHTIEAARRADAQVDARLRASPPDTRAGWGRFTLSFLLAALILGALAAAALHFGGVL